MVVLPFSVKSCCYIIKPWNGIILTDGSVAMLITYRDL